VYLTASLSSATLATQVGVRLGRRLLLFTVRSTCLLRSNCRRAVAQPSRASRLRFGPEGPLFTGQVLQFQAARLLTSPDRVLITHISRLDAYCLLGSFSTTPLQICNWRCVHSGDRASSERREGTFQASPCFRHVEIYSRKRVQVQNRAMRKSTM